jgi:hypothetical protein
MVKNVDILTTVQDYKNNISNQGKIAIYNIDASKVICEGEEQDWITMQDEVEKKNADGEVYHLIIVPHAGKQIRAFDWR